MRIEVSFSDGDRKLPYFSELIDFVEKVLDPIPDLLDFFCDSMEVSHVKKKAQEACCESVCQSRRNKAVKK